MEYNNYICARNASWKILIKLGINKLPIKITTILDYLEIPIFSYKSSLSFIKNSRIEHIAKNSDGFTILNKDECGIFYNSHKSINRIRFTLAHELGHILCGHMQNNTITMRNNEPTIADDPFEHEANIFASRLLAPACILYELGVKTPEQISKICKISKQSAEFRLDRLKLLEQRNNEFLKKERTWMFLFRSNGKNNCK